VCGEPVPKTLAQRIHRCPFCKTVMDRDHNAAQNILLKSTAGTAGINAWGEAVYQRPSLNQEALSLRTG
ncbi:MAG: zinc ribbon domain-containing protein, partial [Proteobacteria bacterium]|nr:zinc ribbon domain-containing protein [Pseudomonadota bacterium]